MIHLLSLLQINLYVSIFIVLVNCSHIYFKLLKITKIHKIKYEKQLTKDIIFIYNNHKLIMNIQ